MGGGIIGVAAFFFLATFFLVAFLEDFFLAFLPPFFAAFFAAFFLATVASFQRAV